MGKMFGSRLSLLTLGIVSTACAYLRPKSRAVRPRKRHFPRTYSHGAANEPRCVENAPEHAVDASTCDPQHAVDTPPRHRAPIVTALAAASLVTAGPALAADALPSAIAAYSHYLALMGIVGSLTTCLTVRGTQTLVSFAPLAFKLFYAARQNAVLRRSPFPSP